MANIRRDKGEGSVFQRADKRWVSEITIGKIHKTFYGKTSAEVKAKLKEFKNEMIKNDYTYVQKITVEEYMNRWTETTKKNQLKPRSYLTKQCTLNNHVYPYIGKFQIGHLTSDDVQAMINVLTDKGLAYSTIKKAYD